MKRYLSGIASVAALLAFTVSAHAASFLYTGALDSYLVTASGTYDFTVAGAPGSQGEGCNFDLVPCGGRGALISGDIYLDAGTLLSVLVGGVGLGGVGEEGGGGGGMSFIAIGVTPLIVAGGGGGAFWNGSMRGGPGQIGTSGQSFAGVAGGVDGQGGPVAPVGLAYGGSGAGWLSDGAPAVDPLAGSGSGGLSGPSFAGGAGYTYFSFGSFHEGETGGFGGGGGSGLSYGGGGGGYSGGAAGGGGGGSFIDPSATNINAIAGGNDGFGYVDINFLSAIPEPATWAMMLAGFGAVGFAMRNRRKLAEGPSATFA
jgi:hypothetical protein